MALIKCCVVLLFTVGQLCVNGEDLDVNSQTSGDFEFIYHERHRLLLTIHGSSCYYTLIESELHGDLMGSAFRGKLQERVTSTILDPALGHGQIEGTTLAQMRDQFDDLLADFHCLSRDVFYLRLDYVGCDFEDRLSPLCTWRRVTDGENLEWTIHKGQTESTLTGPSFDHTKQTAEGTYLYLEANEGVAGQSAVLESAVVNGMDGGGMCIRFWYNMYGDSIGNLSVFMQQNNNKTNTATLWTLSGNQGQGWKVAEVSVYPGIVWAYNMRLYVVATKGSDIYGDIAIDDISSTAGICVPDKFTCDFEHDMCHWNHKQEATDQMVWNRHNGRTSTPHTGPFHADVTDQHNNTFYLLFNASSGFPNQMALLQSDVLHLREPICLTFLYHMQGRDVGELNLIQRKFTGRIPVEVSLWDEEGDQGIGSNWKQARVTVPAVSPDDPTIKMQLVFQATRGASPEADIAIDQILGVAGSCDQYANNPPVINTFRGLQAG